MYSNDQGSNGPFTPKISVIGVGGAGGNAVNNMIASKLEGVNFLAVNTDAQALENSLSKNTIRLGTDSTGGLGAGARPEIGRAAAEETLDEVMAQLADQNMVFITAGMGGGTGTGAAPIIAQACKDRGILTVGVVTKPFQFEGAQRMRQAEAGIDELAQYVDTLIVIPNQNLFRIANEKTTFADAFKMADNVLQAGVRGLTDLMVVPGMINLDFADVRSATSEMGKAMMGTGEATGDRRAIEAAEQAINNPLLDDVSMKGARSVIINVCGGHDLTLFEIEEASNRITEEVDPDATIIFGSTIDDSLEGVMRITVVATGIEAEMNRRAAARPLRATNTNAYQIKQPVEANETLSDSFVARYPEPSRHGSTSSSYSGHAAAASTAPQQPQDISYHTAESSPAMPEQQQAVAAMDTTPIADTYTTVQDDVTIGTVETEYVAEGATMRRVDVQQDYSQAQQSYNNVIPPFAPPRDQQAPRESSLTLNPPARHTPQIETRKTPSLFDRITGRNRSHDTDFDSGETNSTSESSSNGTSGAMMSGLTAPRKTIVTNYDSPADAGAQGMLNIESPKADMRAKQNVTDDLDIPAFLRRQIS